MPDVADMLRDVTQEEASRVLNLLKGARVTRDVTTSLGIKNYDLQRPEKVTKAWWFPLSRMTPNVPGDGDTATHWVVVTGVNTANYEGGVPEGQRAPVITSTVAQKSATYATYGLEDAVTWEARDAAQGFTDLRARTGMRLMLATQQAKERAILGGNTSQALGTPVVATPVDHGTGGTLVYNTTYHVRCVALTPAGYRQTSVSGGVVQTSSVTAPDGTTVTVGYGASALSTDVSVTTANDSNSTHSVSATVTAVQGAVAYAWFIGTGASTARIAAITTINSVVLTSAPGSGQQASAIGSDSSANPLVTDGFITIAGQNGQVITQATGTAGTGTELTADGAGGIVEINNLLKSIFDATQVSPDSLIMASQEVNSVYLKSMAGGSAPLFRFNVDAGDTTDITLGRVIGAYLNRFTVTGGNLVKVILHPDMPPGTMIALTSMVPGQLYPGSELGQLFEWHQPNGGQIQQTEWPVITRKFQTGVYERGVLAHYFPATLGMITNIAA